MRHSLSFTNPVIWLMAVVLFAAAPLACNKPKEAGPMPATKPASHMPLPQSAPARPGVIAPHDLLSVGVFDLARPGCESVKPVRVAADGTIRPFYLGPVHVAGLTDADAEDLIAKKYQETGDLMRQVVQIRRLQVAAAGEDLDAGPIGDFDLIRVSVSDLPGPGSETVTVTRVDGEGMIGVPYLGKQKLAGLTDQEAEDAVARAYRDQNIVQKAAISVFRLEKAPTEAGQTDLPDLPLHPIPEFLKQFYREGELTPEALIKSH